jgi:hypothetical protein
MSSLGIDENAFPPGALLPSAVTVDAAQLASGISARVTGQPTPPDHVLRRVTLPGPLALQRPEPSPDPRQLAVIEPYAAAARAGVNLNTCLVFFGKRNPATWTLHGRLFFFFQTGKNGLCEVPVRPQT